jgi:hypothetical protein
LKVCPSLPAGLRLNLQASICLSSFSGSRGIQLSEDIFYSGMRAKFPLVQALKEYSFPIRGTFWCLGLFRGEGAELSELGNVILRKLNIFCQGLNILCCLINPRNNQGGHR